jgi:putative transposase
MKASKFSEAQKAFILKQGADGVPVADICRKAGISQATYFNWKKKYDGMTPPEMRRLRQLEDEKAKLKRIVADLSLDKEMLQWPASGFVDAEIGCFMIPEVANGKTTVWT